MAKLIRCECGFTALGNDDNEVIDVIQRHIASDHPALLDTVTRDDMRSWIQTD
jgi:predicted small metal-binding protein